MAAKLLGIAATALSGMLLAGTALAQYHFGNLPSGIPLVQPLPPGVLSPIDPDIGPLANPVFYVPSLGMTLEQRPVGLKVISADTHGVGRRIGLRPGDRILAVNNTVLKSQGDFHRSVVSQAGPAEVVVHRFGQPQAEVGTTVIPFTEDEARQFQAAIETAATDFQAQQEIAQQSVFSRGEKRVNNGNVENVNIAGAWSSNFGSVSLTQEGTRVTGQMTLVAHTGLPLSQGFAQDNITGARLQIDEQAQFGMNNRQANYSRRVIVEGEMEGNQFLFRWAAGDGAYGDGRLIISASGTRMFGSYENAATNTVFNLHLTR